jgi:hypothetical protein
MLLLLLVLVLLLLVRLLLVRLVACVALKHGGREEGELQAKRLDGHGHQLGEAHDKEPDPRKA